MDWKWRWNLRINIWVTIYMIFLMYFLAFLFLFLTDFKSASAWILKKSLQSWCSIFHHDPTSGKICHASWLQEIHLSLCMEQLVFDTYQQTYCTYNSLWYLTYDIIEIGTLLFISIEQLKRCVSVSVRPGSWGMPNKNSIKLLKIVWVLKTFHLKLLCICIKKTPALKEALHTCF